MATMGSEPKPIKHANVSTLLFYTKRSLPPKSHHGSHNYDRMGDTEIKARETYIPFLVKVRWK